MKPNYVVSLLTTLIISAGLSVNLTAQIRYIPGIPDLQQPIGITWGNSPDHTCAPAAAANICIYWDSIIHHSNAEGLNPSVPFLDYIPAYLYYFMGTNGGGDPTRANPTLAGPKPGTITMDIDTGLQEYVRWDASHMFTWPYAMPAKRGFDWDIKREETEGFHFHLNEIEMGRPDIIVFKYWNPDSTGVVLPDELGVDSIHFFLWGPPVTNTTEPDPPESFYFNEIPNSVGHAVTGVGYAMGWDPDDAGPLPMTDWLICHDNWPTTPENVAIPWMDPDPNWIATITVDPGLDTVFPYISCRDTTVYLDESGQYHLDVSYITDSVSDNNGVEQWFIDENDVYCYHTGSPVTRKASAMDMFGNLSHCTASVTVLDTIRPIPHCSDTAIYLDSSGVVDIDSSYVDEGSSDNCGIATVGLSRASFNCDDVGQNMIDVTVTDVNSNSVISQVTVTVLDTVSPTVTCTDTTIYLDDKGSFTIDSTFVILDMSDNCSLSYTVLSRSVFDTSALGNAQPVIASVYDESGNSSTCEVMVTVLDTITSSVNSESVHYSDFEFTIIPNPSGGNFTLVCKTTVGDCNLEIYSLSGTLLYNKVILGENTELDISHFSKGIYIIKVRGEGGLEYRDKIILR